MMLSFIFSLIVLYTADYGCIGYSLDCTKTPNMCSRTNINCTQNEDCFISCNEQKSCISSTITCPMYGDCNIDCDGWQACKDVAILSQHSLSGNLNIICTDIDSADNCLGITVHGSTSHINDGGMNMNVLCNGALQSCMQSKIICPITGNCLVSCNGDKSCKYSTITGPINGDLSINCNGDSSCFGSIFNAKQSQQMDISGCIAIDSCLDLSIYCPPTSQNTVNCFIQGNDNIGSTKIYAIYGWEDIQIDYSGNFALGDNGVMHCGNNYNISCEIAANEWKCEDAQDVNMCNVGFVSTVAKLPDLSNDFEHGTMGMIVIGGGLIAVAIGCILCGVVRQIVYKIEKTVTSPKEHQDAEFTKSSSHNKHQSHHVEAIIDGEEPSYEDENGVIHHQHNQHERKVSSLHDRPKLF